MSKNVMLGFPNMIDAATLSGGSFVPTLPRANLHNRVLRKVARTTDLLAASTYVDLDLGVPKLMQAFGVLNHNFSLDATYRLRGSDAVNFSTTKHDSGVVDVWPTVYPFGTLEWEDDNWWSGKYTAEQIAGYTPSLIITTPSMVYCRYWRFEVFDAGNPAGFVQWGRVFISRVWQPKMNMIYGASIGWETKTEVQEALSGTEYFNRRIPYRVQKFSLDAMTEDEAFAQAFEMQRQAGIDQEILFIHNPEDTTHAIRRQYPARFRQLNPIEFPYFATHKAAFEMKELI